MTRLPGLPSSARRLLLAALAFAPAALHAQTQPAPFFTPGNLVVVVEGCGVQGGTCANIANGNGTGGSYGDNQAAPLSLFQFAPSTTASVTYVNSLVLPQTARGANLPIAGEYGSSSEGGLTLSGQGQYLTLGTYGVNAASYNANVAGNTAFYGGTVSALAQSSSLTGKSYTPVARVVTLVDPFGNVNSSSAIFNIFDTNNPRSVYTVDGQNAWLSGQGASGDATGGVFYSPLFKTNNAPTAITGLDTSANTAAQDTRFLSVYNNTLYISVDSKGGSNNARSFIGTLGTPPSTTLFNNNAGPTQIAFFNNAGAAATSTSKIVLTASEANTINAPIIAGTSSETGKCKSTPQFNLSPSAYFFANAYTLYVADTGNGKQDAANCHEGDGGLQKYINTKLDGTGNWVLQYTMSQGLNLVANPASSSNTSGTTGLYGLTGVVVGNNVYLYTTNATIGDLDPTFLYGITDPLAATVNPNTPFTQLAAAPADSNFKGIAFAPTTPASAAIIHTVPEGLTVTTSGTGCAAGTYVTPVTLSWTAGSACSLTTTAPQSASGTAYVFSQWQDGTTNTTDAVLAPTGAATYTATFTSNYKPAGSLDKAVDNTTGSTNVSTNALLVSGWAGDPADGSPLSNVTVNIDGKSAGTPTLGIARPDVPAYPNSGYQLVTPTTGLALGAHAVTVVAVDAAGNSTTFGPLSFNLVATPAVTVQPLTIALGSTTSLSAQIAYGATVPSATNVTFTVNGSSNGVGTVTCTGTTSPVTCTAPYTSAGLVVGTYPIAATVVAANTTLAAGGTSTLTITAAPDFSFQNSGNTTQTVTRGGTATFTFNVNPLFATYPSAVSFTATGLPAGATATFSPSTIAATASQTTVTLSIATAAATSANTLPNLPWLPAKTSLAIAGLCLLPLGFRRNMRSAALRNLTVLLFSISTLIGLAGLMGCSSGGGPNVLPASPTTSTITVTATSGSVTHTTNLTLNIQ